MQSGTLNGWGTEVPYMAEFIDMNFNINLENIKKRCKLFLCMFFFGGMTWVGYIASNVWHTGVIKPPTNTTNKKHKKKQLTSFLNILQINIKVHINKFHRKVNLYILSVESSTLQFFAALSSPHEYTL